jgi:hypothetical protein
MTNFCPVGSSTMAHTGFTIPGMPREECVVFLFQGWILDTPVKYAFGTLGAFAMAFFVEFVIYIRRKYFSKKNDVRFFTKTLRALMFITEVLFSFWCMLLVMTFSTFIVIAVIIGFAIGKVMLNGDIEGLGIQKQNGKIWCSPIDTTTTTTTTAAATATDSNDGETIDNNKLIATTSSGGNVENETNMEV